MMLIPPVSERDHAQGPVTAVITLVEYGDYHNRECAAALPWIESLQSRIGDRLRLVFRHFPASGFPPHAAEAAEAAGLQGRFWPMHKALLTHQSALGSGYLVEYARDMELDTGRFLRDMAGHVCAERVRRDLAGGRRSGVQNTPAFFVNGVRQPSSWTGDLSSAVAGSAECAVQVARWADDGAPAVPDGADEGCGDESDGVRSDAS